MSRLINSTGWYAGAGTRKTFVTAVEPWHMVQGRLSAAQIPYTPRCLKRRASSSVTGALAPVSSSRLLPGGRCEKLAIHRLKTVCSTIRWPIQLSRYPGNAGQQFTDHLIIDRAQIFGHFFSGDQTSLPWRPISTTSSPWRTSEIWLTLMAD
jgi:hypothetical protein